MCGSNKILLIFHQNTIKTFINSDNHKSFRPNPDIHIYASGARLKLRRFNDLTKLFPKEQACLPPNRLPPPIQPRKQHTQSCFQKESNKLSLWKQPREQHAHSCFHKDMNLKITLQSGRAGSLL